MRRELHAQDVHAVAAAPIRAAARVTAHVAEPCGDGDGVRRVVHRVEHAPHKQAREVHVAKVCQEAPHAGAGGVDVVLLDGDAEAVAGEPPQVNGKQGAGKQQLASDDQPTRRWRCVGRLCRRGT